MVVPRSKVKKITVKNASEVNASEVNASEVNASEVKDSEVKDYSKIRNSDSSQRNYFLWYQEHKDDPAPMEKINSWFGKLFDLGSIKVVKDVIPLIQQCLQAYKEGLASSGCLSVDVFARCRNILSKYSLQEVIDGQEDVFASVLYCIFVRNFIKWAEDASSSKAHLGRFIVLRCCSDLYRFVGGFDIRLYEGVLTQYLPTGGKIYDPSMGWGQRLITAQKYDVVEYYGTDPSIDMYPYYCDFVKEHSFHFPPHLYNCGSEVFIPEMEGQMDLTCTCPPYYMTEIYPSTDGWKSLGEYEQFVQASTDNCYRYLKDGCWSLWYLSDSDVFKDFRLTDLYIKCMERSGFKEVRKEYYFHSSILSKSKARTYWVIGKK